MRIRPAVTGIAIVAVLGLGACSSGSSEEPAAPASAPASPVEGEVGTAEMRALCDEMVNGALTPEDATALAEQNGFAARVGSIDGEEQMLTMDFREDRFTFEVVGGAVVGCTYG